MATSGFGPASAMATLNATGSLSMRTTPSSSPASFSRTINDRRRCRSMATYCRSKGPLLVVERVGFVASSVELDRTSAGGDPALLDRDGRTTTGPPTGGCGPSPMLSHSSKSEASALSSHHVPRAR